MGRLVGMLVPVIWRLVEKEEEMNDSCIDFVNRERKRLFGDDLLENDVGYNID